MKKKVLFLTLSLLGCTVILRNNGIINMANGKDFDAPQGAVVQIYSGEINNY